MAATNDAGASKPRKQINGYELISRLGQGAVGIVYKARQTTVDRIVAVKVLDPKFSCDRKYIARFLREAHSAGKLNHVNIVQGIDAGKSSEGYYYFVMEYVQGETVKRMLQRNGVIPEKQAVDIALQVAQALRHASSIKLVHRDIKPENIMVTAEGLAKLADLGLAKSSGDDVAITQAGQSMGTPLYISPEQAKGMADIDARADIYSLGATLYHMVTGFPPFSGENPTVIMLKHMNEPPPSPREHNAKLSPELCHIIQKMMAKNPADRYQTATDLIDDLSALAAGRQPAHAAAHAKQQSTNDAARLSSLQGRPPRHIAPLIAGALAIAVVCIAGYSIFSRDSTEKRDPEPRTSTQTTTEEQPKPHAETQAQQLYEKALALESANDLVGAQSICDQIAREFSNTAAAAPAAGKAAELKEKLDLANRLKISLEAFGEIEKKIDETRKAMAFGRAIELAKLYASDDVPGQVKARAEALLSDMRDEAKKRNEKLKAEAEAFLVARNFLAARDSWNKVKAMGIDAYSREAEKGIARVAAAEREKLEASLKTHRAFWPQFVEVIREKGTGQAEAFADSAMGDDAFMKARLEIEWDKKLLLALRELDNDAIQGLKAMKGKRFTLTGATGIIKEVNEKQLIVRNKVVGDEVVIMMEIEREGGTTITISRRYDTLTAEDRLALAEQQWKRTEKNPALLRAVHRMCIQLDFDAARSEVQLAGLPDIDVQRLRTRIDYLARETEASKAFDDAKAAERSDKWADVKAACERIRNDLSDTWFAGRNINAVDDLLAKAHLKLLEKKLSNKLHAKVRLLSDNRWQFHWDFSTAKQLEDFEAAEPPAQKRDKAKEPIVRDQDRERMLVLRGLDVIARPVFKGAPLQIEYKLKLLEEKAQHGFGRVLLLDRNRQQPYMWEFAYCHGRFDTRKPAADFFRNMYTFGGRSTDWWQWQYSGGRLERNRWYKVKCDITERAAKVEFSGRWVYDSTSITTNDGGIDPAANPDLSGFYQVQFSAWDPDDTWAFADIIITGPIDTRWLEAFVEQQ